MKPLKDAIPNARLVFRRNQESLWQNRENGIYVALSCDSFADYPILYADGRIGMDYPEKFTKAFRATVRATMQAAIRV